MSDHDISSEQEQSEPTPFSFKLMVVMAVLYLGWRLVQGVAAFIRWIN